MGEKRFSIYLYKEAGVSHILNGKSCEDSVAKETSEDGKISAISLSDGAGSRPHALEGSKLVAETAVHVLAEHFELLWNASEKEAADFIIRETCNSLETLGKLNDWPMDSMLATLLCIALHEDGRYIGLHVGDGVIIGYKPGFESQVLSRYEHEAASNVTTFVNVPNTTYKVVKGTDEFASFCLTSDGAEPYILPQGKVCQQVVMMQEAGFVLSETEMEDYMEAIAALLKDECHADDDLSFAMLCDNRKMANIIREILPDFLAQLMDLPEHSVGCWSKRKRNQYADVLEVLHSHPEGVTYQQLGKTLYTHRTSRLLRKLEGMFPGEYVSWKQGKVYLDYE